MSKLGIIFKIISFFFRCRETQLEQNITTTHWREAVAILNLRTAAVLFLIESQTDTGSLFGINSHLNMWEKACSARRLYVDVTKIKRWGPNPSGIWLPWKPASPCSKLALQTANVTWSRDLQPFWVRGSAGSTAHQAKYSIIALLRGTFRAYTHKCIPYVCTTYLTFTNRIFDWESNVETWFPL